MTTDTRRRSFARPTAAPQPTRLPDGAQHAHWPTRLALVALEGLVAVTASYGALFVLPPLPRAWLHQGLIAPFADYTIPALALGILCGGGTLLALVAVLVRPALGALAAVAAGALMVGFELVEILVVGFTPVLSPTEPVAWLQVLYLVVGTLIAAFGALLWKAATGSFRLTWPLVARSAI